MTVKMDPDAKNGAGMRVRCRSTREERTTQNLNNNDNFLVSKKKKKNNDNFYLFIFSNRTRMICYWTKLNIRVHD